MLKHLVGGDDVVKESRAVSDGAEGRHKPEVEDVQDDDEEPTKSPGPA